jgi:hypothetical protein
MPVEEGKLFKWDEETTSWVVALVAAEVTPEA